MIGQYRPSAVGLPVLDQAVRAPMILCKCAERSLCLNVPSLKLRWLCVDLIFVIRLYSAYQALLGVDFWDFLII